MDSIDLFGRQKLSEESGGRRPYDPPEASPAYDLRRKRINFAHGVWAEVTTITNWPWGVLKLQKSALGGECDEVADLIEFFAMLAASVMRSPMGRIRYLMGH
jgi:hypothetical protein